MYICSKNTLDQSGHAQLIQNLINAIIFTVNIPKS